MQKWKEASLLDPQVFYFAFALDVFGSCKRPFSVLPVEVSHDASVFRAVLFWRRCTFRVMSAVAASPMPWSGECGNVSNDKQCYQNK